MNKNRLYLVLFVLLLALAAWLFITRKSSTLNPVLKDFAVADTAAIDKIFMADRKGNQVVLERKGPGNWIVNGKYPAKNPGINTLLYTMKMLEVKSPVGKNLYNNTMKLMAATSVKTEIYQHGKLVKTYYVGHPTMDSQGTFMYLDGSSVPFIMYIPGFQGYLTSRYYAEESEWRDPAIFRYHPGDFTEVKVEDLARPARSFNLSILSDTSVQVLLLSSNSTLPQVDNKKIGAFLSSFAGTSYEQADRWLTKAQHDSLLSVGPFARVSVTEKSGTIRQLRMYRLPLTEHAKFTADQETGVPYPYDYDKFTMQMDRDTNWYICQYYHFDKILKDPHNFAPGVDKTPPQMRH